MSAQDGNSTPHRKSQAEEVSSLRARDVQHISGAGSSVDAGISQEVPATRRNALHGRVKVVQRERFHTLRWYLVIIAVLLLLAVTLGIQLV